MRKLFLSLLFCAPLVVQAQLTQVSGTITDPGGLPYANGTITATLVISGTPRFTSNSLPYTPPNQPVGLSAAGSFTMSLADVTQLTPSGGTWSFHVCSATGTVQPGSPITKGPVCFDAPGFIISGAAENISAQLSAAAPALTPPLGGGGGAGTVNPGTVGQYAIYTGATTVSSTPNLGESAGIIQANLPISISDPVFTGSTPGLGIALPNGAGQPFLQFTMPPSAAVYFRISGDYLIVENNLSTSNVVAATFTPQSQATLTPIASTNQLAANSSGALVYSQNGGAYLPIGSSTRTWSFPFQGVCQGGVASASISIPPTNGPTYVPCDATHITSEWQIPASSTTANFFVKLRVPPGVTGAYTLTTTFRSAATTGQVSLQPAVACVAPGAVPDNPTFSTAGISPITLIPSATTLANVTTTGTFTPTCAAGADLYVQYTFPANTVTSPVNFSYVSLSVQGSL